MVLTFLAPDTTVLQTAVTTAIAMMTVAEAETGTTIAVAEETVMTIAVAEETVMMIAVEVMIAAMIEAAINSFKKCAWHNGTERQAKNMQRVSYDLSV